MSQIQRPTKQGGATTYQGKVGAGYTTILASEMDADLDTIYSAWNTGVDGSNIRPGVITGAMLAPGAVGSRELADGGIQTVDIGAQQITTPLIADGAVTDAKLVGGGVMGGDLQGTFPNPQLSLIQAGQIWLGYGGRIGAGPGQTYLGQNEVGITGTNVGNAVWLLQLDSIDDRLSIYRAPPNTVTFVEYLQIDSAGKVHVTLADGSVVRTQLAVNAPNGLAVSAPVPAGFQLATPNIFTTLVTLPSLTTRGGYVHLHANHCLTSTGPAGGSTCNQRWLRDGVSLGQYPFNVALTASGQPQAVPFPGMNFVDTTCPAGTHVYSYQVLAGTGCIIQSLTSTDGLMQAIEIG